MNADPLVGWALGLVFVAGFYGAIALKRRAWRRELREVAPAGY
jgi:hypothetical protein